jgi:hypothetical protein
MIDLTETQGITPVKPYARLFHKITPTVSASALGYYVATYYRTDKVLIQGVPELGGNVISPSRFGVVRPALPEYMPDIYAVAQSQEYEIPAPFLTADLSTQVAVRFFDTYTTDCMAVYYLQKFGTAGQDPFWQYFGSSIINESGDVAGSVTIDCTFDRLAVTKRLGINGYLDLDPILPNYRLDLFRKPAIEITVCSPSVMGRLSWGYLDLERQKQLLQTSQQLGNWTTTT